MSDKQPSSDATVQMTPEEVARLHRQLAGQGTLAPEAGDVAEAADPGDLPTTRARVGAAPVSASPPAAPVGASPPAPRTAPHVSGPVVMGGVGALVALAGLVMLFLPNLQGFGNDTLEPGLLGVAVGHLALAIGLFAAASRTSGVAVLVGMFGVLMAAVFTIGFLSAARVLKVDADLGRALGAGLLTLPGLTWFLLSLWAFIGLRRVSAGLGIVTGMLSMLGGLAGLAGGVMLVAGAFDGRGTQDDGFIALQMAHYGGVALAMVMVAIASFGPLARAPKLA